MACPLLSQDGAGDRVPQSPRHKRFMLQGSGAGSRGLDPIHADLGGVRLLEGLGRRLNLFAFAVPVFRGDLFAVFEGYFCRLLAVLVPLRI